MQQRNQKPSEQVKTHMITRSQQRQRLQQIRHRPEMQQSGANSEELAEQIVAIGETLSEISVKTETKTKRSRRQFEGGDAIEQNRKKVG